jgi:hypothetical protein
MPSPTTTLSPSQLAQDLGDRVREALGPDADAVEEVTVLAETPLDRHSQGGRYASAHTMEETEMTGDAVACTTEQALLGEGVRWDARRGELL